VSLFTGLTLHIC